MNDQQTRTENADQIEIATVKLERNKVIRHFLPKDVPLIKGSRYIVEEDLGPVLGAYLYSIKIPECRRVNELGVMLREATSSDLVRFERNETIEQRAYAFCQERAKYRNLKIKLVDVHFLFDGKKVIFYYTASGRIDFRELVRDLAQEFRTRIEMRQIGVRDEAKKLSGFGICGRHLCCSGFLPDFEPVSIRMAKEQGLSLIPSKISGICGRLMCCLMYEYSVYREIRKGLPEPGNLVITRKGKGRVTRLNILGERFMFVNKDGESVECCLADLIDKKRMPAEVAEAPVLADAKSVDRKERRLDERVKTKEPTIIKPVEEDPPKEDPPKEDPPKEPPPKEPPPKEPPPKEPPPKEPPPEKRPPEKRPPEENLPDAELKFGENSKIQKLLDDSRRILDKIPQNERRSPSAGKPKRKKKRSKKRKK